VIRRALIPFLLTTAFLLATASPAIAYGGPGSILTGIGALSAVILALVASVFGFFWFPLKRLVTRLRLGTEEQESETSQT